MREKPFRPPLLKQVGNLQQSSGDHPAIEPPTKKRRVDVDSQPVDHARISHEKSNVNPDTRDGEAFYNVLW